MKKIRVKDLNSGQVIARQVIYNDSVLLEKGVALNLENLDQLRKRLIPAVFIHDGSGAGEDKLSLFDEAVDALVFDSPSPDSYEELKEMVHDFCMSGNIDFFPIVTEALPQMSAVLKSELAQQMFALSDSRLMELAGSLLQSGEAENTVDLMSLLLESETLASLAGDNEMVKNKILGQDKESYYVMQSPEMLFSITAFSSLDKDGPDLPAIEKELEKPEVRELPDKQKTQKTNRLNGRRMYFDFLTQLEKLFVNIRKGKQGQFQKALALAGELIEYTEGSKYETVRLIRCSSLRNYLPAHCLNVALLSSLISLEAGFERKKRLMTVLSGLVYDAGMILLDEPVWNSFASISEAEYEMVRNHPLLGAKRLLDAGFPRSVAACSLNHHERFDGNGYPSGKKGSSIDEISSLIGICDVFEAMTSIRSYRPRNTVQQALQFIKEYSGSMFNPDFTGLLESFLLEHCRFTAGNEAEPENQTTVFVVDDHPHITGLMSKILTRQGFEVYTYNDARECWRNWERLRPDLLITDLEMPDMDGYTLCEMIRTCSVYCWAPLVVFSSERTRNAIERLRQFEIKDFIVKPSGVAEINSRIRTALNLH